MWEIIGRFVVSFVDRSSGEKVEGIKFHFARFVSDESGLETRSEFLSISKLKSLSVDSSTLKIGSKVFLGSNKFGKIDCIMLANV